ncbi:MAG: winged helix-turn-helix transcriptional regulator [Mycobacterium sp.]|jgi:DNA-binding HxlR family transcriptional regulator|uniref:winged helix-turn-helix transcriptional regulator n=1 Tax=Mycobacterium sp. TaxID=1785 RepID=UPI00389A281A
MLPSSYDRQDCSLARALEIVGERWTLLVLRDAFYGVRRFNDFLAHLDMPRTVLSNRLRSLTESGVMVKVPDPSHSGRWLYELTDEGLALWPALYALRSWGERHSGRRPRAFTHDACGTQLDATARCETCGVLPPPDHVFVMPVGDFTARIDPVALGLRRKHRLLDFLPRDGDAA